MRAQSNKTLEHPLQWLVAHPEHDAIYVDDPACRSFGREPLRGLCNLMLENLPTGAQCPACCCVSAQAPRCMLLGWPVEVRNAQGAAKPVLSLRAGRRDGRVMRGSAPAQAA